MSQLLPDFIDMEGHPEPTSDASLDAERKLKVWAVLNAVHQGIMTKEEAHAAYGISAREMEQHRAGWLDLDSGNR
ncbi:hypothetical protein [Hymenobacter terrenus]|uniref:hypothetical protein n=1 Tax=Hymenobacter terrenus TaxID=1629124 RepID=UPI0006196B1E|nr:hypothetical protein [Hymenobacter terrenus]